MKETNNPQEYEKTLKIPLGIRNLKILCENPRAGKKNMPIFRYFLPEILNQCNTHPDKTHLSFMRKCIAKGSRGKFYPDQKLLVEGQGFGVTSLTERIFFNVVCILTSGTCPDVRTPKTHARTPDSVALNGDNYQLAVGNFDPRGLDVLMGNSNSVDVGVAPGVPAEVRPSGT